MKMNRREWLGKSLVGMFFLGVGGLLVDVWMSASRFSSAHWTQLMGVGELPGDGTYPFPEHKLALVVEKGKIAAISLECTHLGCIVSTSDEGFFCPCHGSEFGPQGNVYSGPAPKALPWYSLRVDKDYVWYYSGSKSTGPSWLTPAGINENG